MLGDDGFIKADNFYSLNSSSKSQGADSNIK